MSESFYILYIIQRWLPKNDIVENGMISDHPESHQYIQKGRVDGEGGCEKLTAIRAIKIVRGKRSKTQKIRGNYLLGKIFSELSESQKDR